MFEWNKESTLVLVTFLTRLDLYTVYSSSPMKYENQENLGLGTDR